MKNYYVKKFQLKTAVAQITRKPVTAVFFFSRPTAIVNCQLTDGKL